MTMAIEVKERVARGVARISAPRVSRDASIIFCIAFALRGATVLFSRGGAWGNFGYDGSVYYSAADALTFGRLPYRDFVLLHPPAVMLALTPFAAFGRLVGDHLGYVVANTGFEALGALNAALVVLVARRSGLSRGAALIGGLFYAVWSAAVGAEVAVRLEPLGSAAFLAALLALAANETRLAHGVARRRELMVAGVFLGFAVSTKIWWIVPAVIVIAWQCAVRRRQASSLAAGFGAAVIAVNGVFFIGAPAMMWRMVIAEQVGRPRSATSSVQRIEQVASLQTVLHGAAPSVVRLVLLVLAALVVAAGASAWRVTRCRILVAVLVAQLVVLLAAPSFFTFYAGYVAASASLVLAAGTHRGFGNRTVVPIRAIALVLIAAAAAATINQAVVVRNAVQPFPAAQLAESVESSRCVMADSPMALIELNALSRGLAHGCPNWIDVTGRTYGVDRAPVSRARNERWQHDLRRYLLRGDAVILIRAGTGASPATEREITGLTRLRRVGRYTVYRTSPAVDRTGLARS